MIRKVFLDRGRVLPSLVEFLHRHPEILHHLFSDGVIPGEQADEVEAFNHSQAMEAYNTAEARGENVTKPQKSKKMKAKNPTSIAVPTALPFPANRGSPGNMTANRFGPVNPFPSSHNQQGGIASATAQSQFGHFTARTNTNPVLGNQNLDIGNQRKGSIVLYEHRYGEFINELASLGHDNYYSRVVSMVEAADGNKELAVQYLIYGVPQMRMTASDRPRSHASPLRVMILIPTRLHRPFNHSLHQDPTSMVKLQPALLTILLQTTEIHKPFNRPSPQLPASMIKLQSAFSTIPSPTIAQVLLNKIATISYLAHRTNNGKIIFSTLALHKHMMAYQPQCPMRLPSLQTPVSHRTHSDSSGRTISNPKREMLYFKMATVLVHNSLPSILHPIRFQCVIHMRPINLLNLLNHPCMDESILSRSYPTKGLKILFKPLI